ncbi:14514_t:CDS:1, partial [Funneliformis caledonium]
MKYNHRIFFSLHSRNANNYRKGQFVRNIGVVIECNECNKWRVLYSKSKLSPLEISTLERYLDTIQYICGDSFENLGESDDVGEIFKKVKIDNGLLCDHLMDYLRTFVLSVEKCQKTNVMNPI